MQNRLNKDPLFSPTFFHLFFTNLFFFLSLACLYILPDHLNKLGASKTYIGFFMNIQSLELVIFVVFFGRFSNKIDRKLFIIIGFVLFFVSMFFMFLFCDNLILLLVFRSISSVAFAFGFTLIFSLVYDVIPPNKRRGGAAIFGISGVVSSPIGAFLGERILKHFDVQYLFVLASIFSLISIILALFIKERVSVHKGKDSITIWEIVRKKELAPLIFIALIHGGAFSTFASFIPSFSKERLGVANLSRFFIAFSVIAISTRLFFFKLIEKISKKILIIFSLSFMAIAMLIILTLRSKWELFLVGFAYGIGHSIIFPTLSSSFINIAKEEEKIIFNNVFLTFYTLGLVALSTGLGFVGDIFKTSSIFFTMCLIILIGIGVSIFNKHI
ncbi:MAG: MFS transporter [Spirochaetes bacterium]|nr:MFS transporter [Spirochaetota bacterium]